MSSPHAHSSHAHNVVLDMGADALEPLQIHPFLPTEPQAQFRAQLGLPADVPIVMSGHQPGFWHMGIVAKALAMDSIAQHTGSQSVWIVVDQDTLTSAQLTSLRVPIVQSNQTHEHTWDLDSVGAARSALDAGTPLCQIPALQTISNPPDAARIDTAHIASTLQHHAHESSIAMQFTRASMDELYQSTNNTKTSQQPIVIPATALARTDLFSMLVERMIANPVACIKAYNAAARAFPRAHLRELDAQTGELPMWSIDAQQSRVPTVAHMLDCHTAQLAPRALMMTLMLRLGACELFIHGMGGGEYEKAGDVWLSAWCETDDVLKKHIEYTTKRTVPWLVASATVTPMSAGLAGKNDDKNNNDTNDIPASPEAIAHALTQPHRARNNPALLGDVQLQQHKHELVMQINTLKRTGTRIERNQLFRRLRELVHAATMTPDAIESLATLNAAAQRAHELQHSVELAHDRTYPFFVYSTNVLRDLQLLIDERLGF